MEPMYYIGLDVHKRKISYCVKDGSGKVYAEGSLGRHNGLDLDHWMKMLPQPWSAALEATMFTGLDLRSSQAPCGRAEGSASTDAAGYCRRQEKERPHRRQQDLRQPTLRFSARELYGLSTAIRERRRTLRYRNLLVRQMVQMKIKISALLMEAGVSYNKQRLHKAGYFP